MWFVLGLVSLGVVLAWQIRWRWHRPWRGTPAHRAKGIAYEVRYLAYKDSTFAVQVGVSVPDFFRFELKRETWADRFFKWTGLSVEKQFGHEGFDRLVYIASDDEHMWNQVADSPALRRAAQALLLDTTAGCKVRRVFCAHGKLVVHIHRGRVFGRKDDASRLSRHVAAILPLLDGIAKALRASPPSTQPAPRRDPYLLPGAVVLAVSTALAIHGLVFWLRPVLFDDAFLLDHDRLLHLSLWTGGAILLALLAAHFVFLARSARAHLYLLELLFVGSLGAFSTAAIELREANIEWDRSPVVVREAVVLNKSVSHSRKGGTRHYLHVRDWRDPTDTRKVMVSRAFYDAVVPGQVLVFHERAGRFNAAWARLVGAK
jgi:hypothetical protein